MSLYRSHHVAARFVPSLFQAFVRLYVRPRVEGADTLPTEGSFIIAANHTSHADTAVIFTALPRHARRRFVAAAAQDYFFQGGPWQFFSRILFNAIPVARDRRGGQDPLRHASRALREGYALLLYPEGTRSKNGSIGPFRGGIGRLIAEFPGTPVIPTYVSGTARVMPKGKVVPRPYRVTVRFGEPMLVKAHPKHRATWQSAADEVRDAVLHLGGLVSVAGPTPADAPEEGTEETGEQ
ncbi:1-acyl-sn-glycerol-3-phosphate acyltransferase [Oscillochloris sp. ZM17-4]|uniref:lysophospholipid acyltransferase family protein n=1 Tax=Oscillochloris sp. ZM17-4 TaxID=2866714 RepID=UPI001C72E5F2|nr:lysophospholipid acyltransferase family protein [Oscillochloris sp. ZM17-4]MBX0330613.1 1-acyl-sn-glycerol-3-phosphate acyltransferase [Oscillochloris sp. ZM17-4]